MTTALEGGEGSASCSGCSLPPGKSRYPLYRRLGGPQDRSGQVRKISPPPGFDPRTVQPVVSRYTDYATRPIKYQSNYRLIKWNYGPWVNENKGHTCRKERREIEQNFGRIPENAESVVLLPVNINPYPTAFPYGNGMVLHFYQQQESSTTKTVHKVINKGLKTYV